MTPTPEATLAAWSDIVNREGADVGPRVHIDRAALRPLLELAERGAAVTVSR